MKLHVVGIDLGKTVFHFVGLDITGRMVIRKRCSRTQLLARTYQNVVVVALANKLVRMAWAVYLRTNANALPFLRSQPKIPV